MRLLRCVLLACVVALALVGPLGGSTVQAALCSSCQQLVDAIERNYETMAEYEQEIRERLAIMKSMADQLDRAEQALRELKAIPEKKRDPHWALVVHYWEEVKRQSQLRFDAARAGIGWRRTAVDRMERENQEHALEAMSCKTCWKR